MSIELAPSWIRDLVSGGKWRDALLPCLPDASSSRANVNRRRTRRGVPCDITAADRPSPGLCAVANVAWRFALRLARSAQRVSVSLFGIRSDADSNTTPATKTETLARRLRSQPGPAPSCAASRSLSRNQLSTGHRSVSSATRSIIIKGCPDLLAYMELNS
jgi:hypothetical protein